MTDAGQFGEGAKVEINRLLQEGCTVKYWTGNANWTFKRLPAPGCTIPELHVQVRPGPKLYKFVSILIIAPSSYPQRLLEVETFLFLQGDYRKVASMMYPDRPWTGMELLLDQIHWGKVFIHGIYVSEAESYKQFGLNYTGRTFVCSEGHVISSTVSHRMLSESLLRPQMLQCMQLAEQLSRDSVQYTETAKVFQY